MSHVGVSRGYTDMTMDWIVCVVLLHGYLLYFDCAVAEGAHYYIYIAVGSARLCYLDTCGVEIA